MDAIVEYFSESVALFPQYPRWLYTLTVLAVFGVTEGLKIPIKLLTKRLKNDNLRRLCNVVIMFIPLALSFSLGALYTLIPCDFSVTACFTWSMTSQVTYEFVSRICRRFKRKNVIDNTDLPEDTEQSVDCFLPQETANVVNLIVGNVQLSADEKFKAIAEKYSSLKK